MGNIFGFIETFSADKKKVPTSQSDIKTKLLKSSDFLRIYITPNSENDDMKKKIFADKRSNTKKAHIHTTVFNKKITKKAEKIEIVYEDSISFFIGYVYTNHNNEYVTQHHIVRSKMDLSTPKRMIATITSPKMKRVHYITVFIPKNVSSSAKFPEDVYTIMNNKVPKLKIEMNAIRESLYTELAARKTEKEKIKIAVQKEMEKNADKKGNHSEKTLTEGFNPLKRFVLWSADGSMKMMDL